MESTTFGLDLAKRIFQLHWIDRKTGAICRCQLKRGQVAEFFANREPGVIAMEACGSAHHWARTFVGLGHEVRLIAAQFVRPFVKSNKSDAADAQAIWEAVQRPGMQFVLVKSEAQQAVLTLHRMREQLVKMRTMQVKRVADFGEAIAEIERKLTAWRKEDKAAKKLMSIPGVGVLTATAAVATVGDAKAFKNGREFAAFVGLAPRQSGTGGRVKLFGISKRGDVYLRTLLIHGARAVITCAKRHEPWL
jgi:transposase